MLNTKNSNLVALFNIIVPVRHLLSSMAILYHVIVQLQKAHFHVKMKSSPVAFFLLVNIAISIFISWTMIWGR